MIYTGASTVDELFVTVMVSCTVSPSLAKVLSLLITLVMASDKTSVFTVLLASLPGTPG